MRRRGRRRHQNHSGGDARGRTGGARAYAQKNGMNERKFIGPMMVVKHAYTTQ